MHGGSQRVLTLVADALAQAGHHVRIACSERPENRGGFQLPNGVAVEPVLSLRGFFPDPYEVPPHQIAETARRLKPLVDWADRLYLHADIFHFRPLLPRGLPLIRSFHDFHYETALVSAFAYGADLTIVPSDYLRRCLQATVGESGVRSLEPIKVVPNGIDLGVYGPDSGSLPQRGRRSGPTGVAPRRKGELILLHPHRPDPRKGIEQALLVVQVLRRDQPTRPVRLLVPRHVDAATDPGTASFYAGVERRARDLGVSDAVEFHPWYGEAEMAALYRFASVTLCLGNFIESFGLTAYESLACGTPVVAARVGALREASGFADLRMVEHGDAAAATTAVLKAAHGMRDLEGARKLLTDRYDPGDMANAYVAAIEEASAEEHRETRTAGLGRGKRGMADARARYSLAPWCHVAGARIYNDYAYGHLAMPGLARVVARTAAGFKLSELAGRGVPQAELDEALRAGVLIRPESTVV